MEELENKKNKMFSVKEHIMKMPNNKMKAELIDAYMGLLQYYSEVLDEEDRDLCEKLSIDDELIGKYDRLLIRDTEKKLSEFIPSTLSLYHKYCKIIETFKENDYCSYAYVSNAKVNPKKMMNLVYRFFESLGEDVLNIYIKMIKNDNIVASNTPMGFMGYTVNTYPVDNPCIVVQNVQKYLDFYLTLVHEVGHAYQFYLRRNQKDFSRFYPYEEITSHLFEKLFLDFLEKEHEGKYNFNFIEEDYLYFLNEVSMSKILCRILTNNHYKAINPYNLECYSYVSLDDINREMINDCGYVFPNMIGDKVELIKFNYSIGKSIAMYFHEKLKNDFDVEWPKYKNFICTMNYLPIGEVLDEYFDVDLVTNNIKKFTKSYRDR